MWEKFNIYETFDTHMKAQKKIKKLHLKPVLEEYG